MKKLIIPAVVVIAVLAFLGFRFLKHGDATSYRFVEVTRGDVRSVVSSTGALQAITTVQVGTQVSGKITEIHADFNDHVKKGQLIARIDPTLLQQAVRSAEADLARAQADLAQNTREFDRISRLYERKAATESEFNSAQYQRDASKASLTSAQVNLERARQNLGYSEIIAPVDGVVLDRTVDVGQTVAASLSAPQLFLIAEDLSKMEILASVDESDIGKIHQGQAATFTVQAYPDSTFSGSVSQVRLQSTTQENVVNYVVVVSVDNPGGKLLPGMTATVEFTVAEAKDVLKIPNAGLRFRPTEAMAAEIRKRFEEQRAARGAGAADSALAGAGERRPGGMGGWSGGANGGGHRGGRFPGAGSGNRSLLYYLDDKGELAAMPVRTGITDGQSTEISGPRLQEGMQIIASVTTGEASTTTANPFQGQQSQRRFGPPPGM